MSNFQSIEKRLDKIEDALEHWGKPVDASNLFDVPLFSDEERREWAAFWQRIGFAFQSETINTRDLSGEDLAILKTWALLYKSRTEAPA